MNQIRIAVQKIKDGEHRCLQVNRTAHDPKVKGHMVYTGPSVKLVLRGEDYVVDPHTRGHHGELFTSRGEVQKTYDVAVAQAFDTASHQPGAPQRSFQALVAFVKGEIEAVPRPATVPKIRQGERVGKPVTHPPSRARSQRYRDKPGTRVRFIV